MSLENGTEKISPENQGIGDISPEALWDFLERRMPSIVVPPKKGSNLSHVTLFKRLKLLPGEIREGLLIQFYSEGIGKPKAGEKLGRFIDKLNESTFKPSSSRFETDLPDLQKFSDEFLSRLGRPSLPIRIIKAEENLPDKIKEIAEQNGLCVSRGGCSRMPELFELGNELRSFFVQGVTRNRGILITGPTGFLDSVVAIVIGKGREFYDWELRLSEWDFKHDAFHCARLAARWMLVKGLLAEKSYLQKNYFEPLAEIYMRGYCPLGNLGDELLIVANLTKETSERVETPLPKAGEKSLREKLIREFEENKGKPNVPREELPLPSSWEKDVEEILACFNQIGSKIALRIGQKGLDEILEPPADLGELAKAAPNFYQEAQGFFDALRPFKRGRSWTKAWLLICETLKAEIRDTGRSKAVDKVLNKVDWFSWNHTLMSRGVLNTPAFNFFGASTEWESSVTKWAICWAMMADRPFFNRQNNPFLNLLRLRQQGSDITLFHRDHPWGPEKIKLHFPIKRKETTILVCLSISDHDRPIAVAQLQGHPIDLGCSKAERLFF